MFSTHSSLRCAVAGLMLAGSVACSKEHGTTGSGSGNGSGAGTGGASGRVIGQTSFVSQPAGQGGGREELGGTAQDNGTTPNASPSNTGSGSSTSRTITEADIYKVVGNTLYILNQYRGLQIVDVTNLSSPQLVARVPVVGNPIDLYVEGTTAYVVVSDYFWFGWDDLAGGDWAGVGMATPYWGSQVWAIDVTNPAAPNVLSQLPLDGTVEDTRIVGNILYVVSDVYTWNYYAPTSTDQDLTFVASFDISNPGTMVPVQRQDFPALGWSIHSNVTDNRIVLAESGWTSQGDTEITQFEPIDISDPAGALVLGTAYTASGSVPDRWAMDFDPTTNLFRAVMQNDDENSGGSLQIWSAPNVNTATLTGSLNLNVQESVTAVTYSGPRAYVSTAYCTDPLWIIDTSNPQAPTVAGSVSLPGAVDFLEPVGNTLIALGHQSSGCNAWEGVGQLGVTLFDVSNPATASVLSQVSFGTQDSSLDVSADDMRKAFQVLSNPNLILVPFQSWDDVNYDYVGGTQLIDYSATSLTLRGFAQHDGSIERAFPVQDKLAAFSDRTLQIIDATNEDAPTTFAQIDLARPVIGLTAVGNQLVELSGDWTVGDTELAVTSASTPDQAVPNATVRIPAPNAQTFVDGTIMWVLANDYNSNSAWLQAVDVSNPSTPVLRGRLAIDPSIVPGAYGGWYSWGYGDEAVVVNHALVIHLEYYGCWGDYCGSNYVNPPDQIEVIDLTNPDAPTLGAPLTLPDSDWSWGLTAVGNYAWITHYEWLPDTNWQYVSYYVDRIDLTTPSAPVLLDKINVPGVFLSASDDGQTIYTQDESYTSNWDQTWTTFSQLTLLPTGQAALDNSVTLSGYTGGAFVNNGYAYVETWNYDSVANTSQAVLTTIDLDQLAVTSTQTLASNWAWIMKATGGKLFIQADWNDAGILIYDLADPSSPLFQGSVRTEGWVEDVVVSGNTAYLPSGDYGVPMIDLTPGSPLPANL